MKDPTLRMRKDTVIFVLQNLAKWAVWLKCDIVATPTFTPRRHPCVNFIHATGQKAWTGVAMKNDILDQAQPIGKMPYKLDWARVENLTSVGITGSTCSSNLPNVFTEYFTDILTCAQMVCTWPFSPPKRAWGWGYNVPEYTWSILCYWCIIVSLRWNSNVNFLREYILKSYFPYPYPSPSTISSSSWSPLHIRLVFCTLIALEDSLTIWLAYINMEVGPDETR